MLVWVGSLEVVDGVLRFAGPGVCVGNEGWEDGRDCLLWSFGGLKMGKLRRAGVWERDFRLLGLGVLEEIERVLEVVEGVLDEDVEFEEVDVWEVFTDVGRDEAEGVLDPDCLGVPPFTLVVEAGGELDFDLIGITTSKLNFDLVGDPVSPLSFPITLGDFFLRGFGEISSVDGRRGSSNSINDEGG